MYIYKYIYKVVCLLHMHRNNNYAKCHLKKTIPSRCNTPIPLMGVPSSFYQIGNECFSLCAGWMYTQKKEKHISLYLNATTRQIFVVFYPLQLQLCEFIQRQKKLLIGLFLI